MSHLNFAGRSGVILDRCGTHGVWLEGGELRRLAEWWRAGGKLIFQQHEADKTRRLYQAAKPMGGNQAPRRMESPDKTGDWSWGVEESLLNASDLLSAAVEIVVSCITD